MKKYLLYFSFFFLSLILLSCSEAQNKSGLEELTPQAFQALQQRQQGVLLDVRTPEEFTEDHIAQSVNIDYKNSNFESELRKLDKEAPYFLYCKSGVRSAKAGDRMHELGFTKVYLLDGGIDAWKEQGLPVSSE